MRSKIYRRLGAAPCHSQEQIEQTRMRLPITVGPLLVARDRHNLSKLVCNCAPGSSVVLRLQNGRVQYFKPSDVEALKRMGFQTPELPKIIQSNPSLRDDFFSDSNKLGSALLIYSATPPYTLLYLETDYLCRLNKPDCQGQPVTHVDGSISAMRLAAIEKAIQSPNFEQRYAYPYVWELPGEYSYSKWWDRGQESHQLWYTCSAIYLEGFDEIMVRVYDINPAQKALFERVDGVLQHNQLINA